MPQALNNAFSDLQAEFRSVPMETIIPFGAWLREKPWNVVWAKWFLVYALFPFVLPLVIMFIDGSHSSLATIIKHIGWAYATFFAVLWLLVLYLCMKPGRLEYRLLASTAGFTAIAGITLVLLLQRVPPFNLLYQSSEQPNILLSLIGNIFGVGLLEECCKALPVYLMVFRTKREYPPLMYAYVGAVSGLAFGVVEAGHYTVKVTGQIQTLASIPIFLLTIFLRLITLPLLHACWSATSCYFMGLAYLNQRTTRALFFIGLGIPVLLHGLYDTFADISELVDIVLVLISLLLFIAYVQTGNMISRRLTGQGEPLGTQRDNPTPTQSNYDL
jgi:RsiW-degrading membrane proteinase PrsW (M82 family)